MNATFFLSGITMATFAAAALFFFKFWRASHDRFFLYFGVACILIASERVLAFFTLASLHPLSSALTEATSWVYLVRLMGFVMILLGVYQKNRSNS